MVDEFKAQRKTLARIAGQSDPDRIYISKPDDFFKQDWQQNYEKHGDGKLSLEAFSALLERKDVMIVGETNLAGDGPRAVSELIKKTNTPLLARFSDGGTEFSKINDYYVISEDSFKSFMAKIEGKKAALTIPGVGSLADSDHHAKVALGPGSGQTRERS